MEAGNREENNLSSLEPTAYLFRRKINRRNSLSSLSGAAEKEDKIVNTALTLLIPHSECD